MKQTTDCPSLFRDGVSRKEQSLGGSDAFVRSAKTNLQHARGTTKAERTIHFLTATTLDDLC